MASILTTGGHLPRKRLGGFSRPSSVDPETRLRGILADTTTPLRVHLVPRELWAKREERSHCAFCDRKFRTFSRKVYCRGCGGVVCSSCYRKKDVQIGVEPTETLPARLCFDCIDLAIAPPSQEEDLDDSVEGSFTNSGRVTISACSSHMNVVDGLLVANPKLSTNTDSFVNLELSHYEDDSDACDTDRESNYSYDSDGDTTEEYYIPRARRTSSIKSLGASTVSTSSSSGSTSSSSGYHTLGFVPEDESLGDFVDDMKLTLSDLEVDPETRRAELLKQYNVAALDRQREFDALCELVSRALHCGVAAVGFMGETAQWYKSKIGISQALLPREVAFCSQLLDEVTPTVVLDATQDARFCGNPLVTGSAHIRFYASTPICDPETQLVLGSVFVMDPLPKTQLPARAMEVLAYASATAEKLLVAKPKRSKRRHSKQKRIRRVYSEPALSESFLNDEDDDDDEGYPKTDGTRGSGALWTSDPPLPQSIHPSRSFHSSSGTGIELLDSASLSSLRTISRRGSAASDYDEHPSDVLGRSAPPKIVTPPSSSLSSASPGLCDEIRLQIETTRQLLASFGPQRRKPAKVLAEVEV